MVGAIPRVVEIVLEEILETEEYQDFRIVGNKYGTTLVLRYSMLDMVSDRHSPAWQHRSKVNLTRDNYRYNTWIKNNSGRNDNTQQAHSFALDTSVKLNPDAPAFTTQFLRDSTAVQIKCDAECQTEFTPDIRNSSAQTDADIKSVNSTGIQCHPENHSVGSSCVPPTKSKYIQATIKTQNQGTGGFVEKVDIGTDPECAAISVEKKDVGIVCQQSPGACSRHVQTVKKNTTSATTNTIPVVQKSVGVGSQIEVTPHHQGCYFWVDLVEDSIPNNGDMGVCSESGGSRETIEELQSGKVPIDSEKSIPCRNIGKPGLCRLLDNLDIPAASLRQQEESIQNIWHNKYMKGLLRCKFDGAKNDGDQNNMYWAVYDDIGLQFSRRGQKFHLVQYVKLRGKYLDIMCMDDDNCEFSLIDMKSDIYKQCERAAKVEILPILDTLRKKNRRKKNSGGYGGGFGTFRGYGGYGGGFDLFLLNSFFFFGPSLTSFLYKLYA